jgi:hypothetical protein
MPLAVSPNLTNALWIIGGAAGLLLVTIIAILWFRR